MITYTSILVGTLQEATTSDSSEERWSQSRILSSVFAAITAVNDVDAADAEIIALETLFDAHHPAIGTPLSCRCSCCLLRISNSGFCLTVFTLHRVTVVLERRNGIRQPLICVLW